MKILYHHSAKWPSNSPSISFITYTCLGFAKAGFDIELLVWNNSESDTNTIFKEVFNLNEIPNNLIITRLDARNKHDYYRKSFNHISNNSSSHIISRALTFLPKLIALKEYGKRVFFETHDFYSELMIRRDIKKIKKIRHWFLESLYFNKLDGIISLQSAQKEKIESLYSVPIIVAKTGLFNVSDLVDIDVSKRKYWAYIGSFDKHKGIFDFLKSVKNQVNIPIKLIGGKSEHEINNMLKESKKICPHHEIKIIPWLNKNDLKKELVDVKFGVIPLKENYFNSYLTSPLKLFDYYTELIPPIVSDLPSLNDLVIDHKTGFKVDWDEDSTSRLNSIQDQSYLELINNIKIFNESLTWQQRANDIVEGLESLEVRA